MQSICTLLIERNSFLREGIKSLLAQSDYDVATEIPCIAEVDAIKSNREYQLVIHGVDDTDEDICSIKTLKSQFFDTRVVILADELDSHLIKKSFAAGADGFILKDISAKAFIGSLNLIMMGEKVFPTSMATLLSEGWDGWIKAFSSEQANDYDLSSRELDIIRCLANGDTNKFIARTLNITEATVKVHLKTILRKLGLSNRTQAAIWAVSKGIVPCPEIIAHKREKSDGLVGVY